MSSTIFRSPATSPTTPVTPQAPADKAVPRGTSEVEPPFTDYESQKGHPFLVDHYELGSSWDMGDMYSEAFAPEVDSINTYLKHAMDKGEVNNTVESVKNELKRIEKMINVRKDQRKAVKIGLVAEYVNFILKSENIKKESAKYGMI